VEVAHLTFRYWLIRGLQIYKQRFKLLLVAAFIFFIYWWIQRGLSYLPYRFLPMLFSVIVGPPLISGFYFFCLVLAREKRATSKDFLLGFSNFPRIWLTNFFYALIVMVGLILLIIPGIVWGLKYSPCLIIALDKKLSPIQAIKLSGKITQGYKAKLLLLSIPSIACGILLLPFDFAFQEPIQNWSIVFMLIGLALHFISSFFVTPWMFATWSIAYDSLVKQYEEANIDLDINKNKGDISIEFCVTGTPEYESIPQEALQVLQQRNISVSVDNKSEKEGRYIVVEVKNIGTIDRTDMKEFLDALFARKHAPADSVTVTLRHDEKSFSLPDEIQECIDWFHIE
jgi:hypothetical protein